MVDELRYQVFVSSTFTDLAEERSEVMRALLELDCFPAGMEAFPASDDSAWKVIARTIEKSDYYCVIIGGRYGSMDKDGISYTEKEYDLARQSGIPVLPFLHKQPDQLAAAKVDMDAQPRERLAAFRKRLEDAHTCKYWLNAEQLGGRVSRGLTQEIKSRPRTGWIRGDRAKTIEDAETAFALQRRVSELEAELARLTKGADVLESLPGDDVEFNLSVTSESGVESRSIRWGMALETALNCAASMSSIDVLSAMLASAILGNKVSVGAVVEDDDWALLLMVLVASGVVQLDWRTSWGDVRVLRGAAPMDQQFLRLTEFGRMVLKRKLLVRRQHKAAEPKD